MDTVSTLKFRDKDEDQEALAIVRSVNGFIALTLSLEHGGDMQVAFTPAECKTLINHLNQAVKKTVTEYPDANYYEYWHQETVEIDATENVLVGATNH